jgi:hypothetical protein
VPTMEWDDFFACQEFITKAPCPARRRLRGTHSSSVRSTRVFPAETKSPHPEEAAKRPSRSRGVPPRCGGQRARACGPSFETHRFAMLLRMRLLAVAPICTIPRLSEDSRSLSDGNGGRNWKAMTSSIEPSRQRSYSWGARITGMRGLSAATAGLLSVVMAA